MEEHKVKKEAVHSAKMLVPVCHITPCHNTDDDGVTLTTMKTSCL